MNVGGRVALDVLQPQNNIDYSHPGVAKFWVSYILYVAVMIESNLTMIFVCSSSVIIMICPKHIFVALSLCSCIVATGPTTTLFLETQ